MCACAHARLCACVAEGVWCVGALVQGCSVPWCRLEQGSHVDTAARPICASHTVTITELLTLEALSSHIAVKPLTMPHTPIPKLLLSYQRLHSRLGIFFFFLMNRGMWGREESG